MKYEDMSNEMKDKYPKLASFLKRTGFTDDEAIEYLEERLHESSDVGSKEVSDEVVVDAKEWKKTVDRYGSMSYAELMIEAKRRGLL